MKYFVPVIAALSAAPSAIEAWSLGPSYFTSPLLLQSPTMILRRQQALMDRVMQQTPWSSPRYEIIDNEEKFQLSVDVPGVKMEDIDVSLEDGVLSISGHRESLDPNYSFSSKFSQSFSLDPAVELDKFTASLTNGVLVVTAPKDMKKIEANIRKIPITQMDNANQPSLNAAAAEKEIGDEKIDAKESNEEESHQNMKETVEA